MKRILSSIRFFVVGIIATIIAIILSIKLDGILGQNIGFWITVTTAIIFYAIGGIKVIKNNFSDQHEKKKESERKSEEKADDDLAGVSPPAMEDGVCFKVINKQKTISREYHITLENNCEYKTTNLIVSNGNPDYYDIIKPDKTINVPRLGQFTVLLKKTSFGGNDDINFTVEWTNLSLNQQTEVIRIKESDFKN